MSIFTSLVTRVLSVPGDPGQTITIRRLSPKHLERAADVAETRAADIWSRRMSRLATVDLAGLRAVQAALASDAPAPVDAAEATVDPMEGYDRLALITSGVTAWTYERPCDQEACEDLDEETRDWLAREILQLAKPALFRDAAAVESAKKNA